MVDESLLETMRVKPLFRPWSLSATACVKDLLRYRLIAVWYLPFMSTIQFWRQLLPKPMQTWAIGWRMLADEPVGMCGFGG